MYTPIQPGIPRTLKHHIIYREIAPPAHQVEIVQCFWLLSSQKTLPKPFSYLVLPDGCIDIVFDLGPHRNFTGAMVTTRGTAASEFDLGHEFAYIGVRFRPGAWRRSPVAIIGELIQFNILGNYDFRPLHARLLASNASQQIELMSQLVDTLEQQGTIGKNELTRLLLKQSLPTVEQLVNSSGYSRRHLQRLLLETTGYKPHDFIKIIRFQQALQNNASDAYADQSHFIREHKRITGMTPRRFNATYRE